MVFPGRTYEGEVGGGGCGDGYEVGYGDERDD